jgi:hypothetical protein
LNGTLLSPCKPGKEATKLNEATIFDSSGVFPDVPYYVKEADIECTRSRLDFMKVNVKHMCFEID